MPNEREKYNPQQTDPKCLDKQAQTRQANKREQEERGSGTGRGDEREGKGKRRPRNDKWQFPLPSAEAVDGGFMDLASTQAPESQAPSDSSESVKDIEGERGARGIA